MTLSVLICTYNRHELLRLALTAILEKSEELPDQVVVVNGGDDRADEVVKGFQRAHMDRILLLKTVNKNVAASRNLGLPLCGADIVAMTDDDAEVFPDWVTKMKSLHQNHPEAGAVGGLVFGSDTKSLKGRVADLITFPSWPDVRFVRTLPGVNISYKKEALVRLGLQDEQLFRGEDVDFNWRLQSLGYKVLFSPEVRVFHSHRATIRCLMNQQYMYGRAYVLVRRKHPEMYSILPRTIWSVKGTAKIINFLVSIAYESLKSLPRLKALDRIPAFPLLIFLECAWRWGMIRQITLSRR